MLGSCCVRGLGRTLTPLIERPRKVHFSSKNILKHILIDLIKENILIDRMDTTIKLSFNKEDLKKNLK